MTVFSTPEQPSTAGKSPVIKPHTINENWEIENYTSNTTIRATNTSMKENKLDKHEMVS